MLPEDEVIYVDAICPNHKTKSTWKTISKMSEKEEPRGDFFVYNTDTWSIEFDDTVTI